MCGWMSNNSSAIQKVSVSWNAGHNVSVHVDCPPPLYWWALQGLPLQGALTQSPSTVTAPNNQRGDRGVEQAGGKVEIRQHSNSLSTIT